MVARGHERLPLRDAGERLRLRIVWGTAVVAALAATAPSFAVPLADRVTCEGPDVDPWVTDFRDRTSRFNGLAQFAITAYGEPIDCEGAVTSEFDGGLYGTLVLSFAGGVSLWVETMPIETSIVALRAAEGFGNGPEVEEALRAYAARVGVSIDWERAEESVEGQERTQTFSDPDPGLNASASVIRRGSTVVEVRFSMAL
jgi:hypothetical protein